MDIPAAVLVDPVVVDPPPIEGAVVVNAMDTALHWIGFKNAVTRNRLRVEGFDAFDDLKLMTEKDIRDLAESHGRRTAAVGRFIFGIRRIHYLIGMVHWVQDFERVGEIASLDEFMDALAFRGALDIAFDRASG